MAGYTDPVFESSTFELRVRGRARGEDRFDLFTVRIPEGTAYATEDMPAIVEALRAVGFEPHLRRFTATSESYVPDAEPEPEGPPGGV